MENMMNDGKNMDFDSLYSKVQSHISTNFAYLLAEKDNEIAVKEQIINIIKSYIGEGKYRVEGMGTNELIDRIYQEMAELSILTPLLDKNRTDIEEININRWDDIKVTYDTGEIISYPETFRSPGHALDVMKRLLKKESSLILDKSRPIVRGHLHNKIRLTILGDGIIDEAAGVSASLRVINPKQFVEEDFVKRGTATKEMLELLSMLTKFGVSICITGETGSGKTTLLIYLAGNIENSKRVYCIEEDVREFDLTKRDENGKVINNVIHTHTKKSSDESMEIDQDRLLETALTMNPDTIVVSEMKSKEANAAQEASRTGHSVLTTTHAASCRATYWRMVTLCKKAIDMDESTMLRLILEAFPIVVYIQKDADNVRRIKEITESYLNESGEYEVQTLFKHMVRENKEVNGKVVVDGEFVKVNKISDKMKQRLINKNITKDQLQLILGRG